MELMIPVFGDIYSVVSVKSRPILINIDGTWK